MTSMSVTHCKLSSLSSECLFILFSRVTFLYFVNCLWLSLYRVYNLDNLSFKIYNNNYLILKSTFCTSCRYLSTPENVSLLLISFLSLSLRFFIDSFYFHFIKNSVVLCMYVCMYICIHFLKL